MAGSRHWSPTPEQKAEAAAKREALLTEVANAVKSLCESEAYVKALDVSRRFRRYSLGNVLLILHQKSDATRVMGAVGWRGLNRFPKKGSRALYIWAPMGARGGRGRDTADHGAAESGEQAVEGEKDGKKEYSGLRFRLVPVFDVSDTDGDPLPEQPAPVALDDDSTAAAALRTALEQAAMAANVPVTFVTRDGDPMLQSGAEGYYHVVERRIVICNEASTLDQAHVLAHEFAHALGHARELGRETKKHQREIEAESAAYLVCLDLGFKSGGASFPYLAAYNKEPEALMEFLQGGRAIAEKVHAYLDPLWQPVAVERDGAGARPGLAVRGACKCGMPCRCVLRRSAGRRRRSAARI